MINTNNHFKFNAMKTLAEKLQAEKLTEKEQQVMTALINLLYAEPDFSDVDAKDLEKATGISGKSISGVVSSLVKKGFVNVLEYDAHDNIPKTAIIYLNESKYLLHRKKCSI